MKSLLKYYLWLSPIKLSPINRLPHWHGVGVVPVLIRLTHHAQGKLFIIICFIFFPSAVFRPQVNRNHISQNNVSSGPTKCEAWPFRETWNRNEWNKSDVSSWRARANCFLDSPWRKLRRASFQVSPKQQIGNKTLHKVCFHKANHWGICSLAT